MNTFYKSNDALQDIRNEIITRHLKNIEHDDFSNGYSVALEEILSVIDKYNKEERSE